MRISKLRSMSGYIRYRCSFDNQIITIYTRVNKFSIPFLKSNLNRNGTVYCRLKIAVCHVRYLPQSTHNLAPCNKHIDNSILTIIL